MSRISFLNRVIDGNNFVKIDATVDPANMTIYKNGVLYSVTVYNNGDGYYYFEGDASAEYALRISGAEQDEFKEIYCTVREDNITEQNLDPSPEKGDIEISGNYLQVHDGANMVLTTDIIDTLVSTETDQPLSANQGKVLKDTLDALADTDITNIVSQSDINSDLSTGGATKVVSAELLKTELNPSYANPHYIGVDKTIVQNLERLDQAVYNVKGAAGLAAFRVVWAFSLQAGFADGNSVSAGAWLETGAGGVITKAIFGWRKRPNDEKIIFRWQAKGDSESVASGRIVLLHDGVTFTYCDDLVDNGPGYADHEYEIDISTLNDGIYQCLVGLEGYSGRNIWVKCMTVEVKYSV